MDNINESTDRESIALVTGAAGGIGTAICDALRQMGCRVIALDRHRLEASADEVDWVQQDLSTSDGCAQAVADTLSMTNGRLDILVNNAGMQHVRPIHDFEDDDWDRLLAVMLSAPFRLSRGFWEALTASSSGRIVNIASIHALVGSPGKAAYVSAKHGLLGLTKVQALEGGPHGLSAVAICPGYVRTPMVQGQIDDQARTLGLPPDEVLQQVMLEPAAIRRLIEPAEVAAHVAFLCGPAGRSVSGCAVPIDGAWTAR